MLDRNYYTNAIQCWINNFPIEFLNTFRINNSKKIKTLTEDYHSCSDKYLSNYYLRYMSETFKKGFFHYINQNQNPENEEIDINSLRKDLNNNKIKDSNYWIKEFDKIITFKKLNIYDYDNVYYDLCNSKSFFLTILHNIINQLIKDLYLNLNHNLLTNDNSNNITLNQTIDDCNIDECSICFGNTNIYKCKICNTFVCNTCLITNYMHEIIKILYINDIEDTEKLKFNCITCKKKYDYKRQDNIDYWRKINICNEGRYIGNIKNNQRKGQGIMRYKNGNIYQGNWYNNKKHGNGIMIYKSGEKYYGDWKKDKLNFGYSVKEINESKFNKNYNILTEDYINIFKKIHKKHFKNNKKFLNVPSKLINEKYNILAQNYLNSNLNLSNNSDYLIERELSECSNSSKNSYQSSLSNNSDNLIERELFYCSNSSENSYQSSLSENNSKLNFNNQDDLDTQVLDRNLSVCSGRSDDSCNTIVDKLTNLNFNFENDKYCNFHHKYKKKYFEIIPFYKGAKVNKNINKKRYFLRSYKNKRYNYY